MAGFNYDTAVVNIKYYLGQYLLKEESQEVPDSLMSSLEIFDIDKTWYVDNNYSTSIDQIANWDIYTTDRNESEGIFDISLYANPNENLNTSIASIRMSNVGNIVSPNGASVIFGAEVDESNAIDITLANSHTFNPYNIVIVDEDTDESMPADMITFSPNSGSALTSNNVQSAINELEQVVYSTTPSFSQEVWQLTEGASSQTLNNSYSAEAIMVYYNGLLINNTIHFSLTGKILRFLDFTAENGDILTVIGFSSSGGGSNINAASLIGGSY